MNKLKKLCIGTAIILGMSSGLALSADSNFAPGQKFANNNLGLSANTYILDSKSGDVDNDGEIEDIILTGEKDGVSSVFAQNISLFIYERISKDYKKINFGDFNNGYGAGLFLGDFTNDSTPEIMINIGTGGSGGTSIYSILSLEDYNRTGKVKTLFNQDMSSGFNFDIQFKDNYKIDIVNLDLNRIDTIDVSKNKATYDSLGIYKDGKVTKVYDGAIDGYGILKPTSFHKDAAYELEGRQAIWGAAHVDRIAYADTIIKYIDGEFQIVNLVISDLESENGITTNKVDFKVISDISSLSSDVRNKINSLKDKKGYYLLQNKDGKYLMFIGMGEKPTGGYSINVKSIEDIEGLTKITVETKKPASGDFVTQAITYPYTIIEMKNIAPRFSVVSTNSDKFQNLDLNYDEDEDDNGKNLPETLFGYILDGLKMNMTPDQVTTLMKAKPSKIENNKNRTIQKWYYSNGTIISFKSGHVNSILVKNKSLKAPKGSEISYDKVKDLIKKYGKSSKKCKGFYIFETSDKYYKYYAEVKGNTVIKLQVSLKN